MKVGILTFHRGPNYGGYMQAWHMREAIRSFGHDATLINYQNARHHAAEQIRLRGLSPSAVKGLVLHTLKSLPFRPYVRELSEYPFTTDPREVPWQEFDRVVVGSDVVWNFTHGTHGLDPVFFGADSSQANVPFMAFAPSCGESSPDGELPEYVSRGLKRFESIQVRDEATATLVEKTTGTRPPLVVDPTWLQDDPVVTCGKIPKNLKYALVYGQGATGTRARQLGDYCRKRGLKIVSAASPCEVSTHRLYSIDPFEWADLFRRAECVITSTFHGLLYAIKHNMPLIFMSRDASRSKSAIAIDRCGLHDCVIEEGQQFDSDHLCHCLTQADGCEIPEDWRKQSLALLREAVEK